MELYRIIVVIILQNIQYKNKQLVLDMLKAELLNNFGYITELATVVNPKSYHSIQKVFYRQIFNIVKIQIKIIVAIMKYYNIEFIRIAIDDTFVYRSRKKKVPNGGEQYDHSNKANRKAHIYGQKWLAIIIVLNINGFQISLPLWIHLVKPKRNMITTTTVILQEIRKIMDREGLKDLKVEIVMDSWFAKKRLITRVLERCKFSVISMARVDTVCREELKPLAAGEKRKPGRPKTKGEKIVVKIEDLVEKLTLKLYSKSVEIKYVSKICKADFLGGMEILAIWISFDGGGMRFMLSTDTTLSVAEILKRYEQRWSIENMFNELKNNFRFKDIMVHQIATYYQFFYFKIWCYTIIKLTSTTNINKIKEYVREMLPWRVQNDKSIKITAGITKLAMKSFFSSLEISEVLPKMPLNNVKKFNKNGKPLNRVIKGARKLVMSG